MDVESGAGVVPAPVGGAVTALGSVGAAAEPDGPWLYGYGCTGAAAPHADTLPASAPSGASVQSAKMPAARAFARIAP